MTPDPPTAFKEWAAVCRALATGIQTIILRKGGIAEDSGVFRPEHSRFWLYPTYFHEPQSGGLRPEFLPLLAAAEADRPAAGTVRLTHVAEVTAVRFIESIDEALSLRVRHVWSDETVLKRFAYRKPGLYVLEVRVAGGGLLNLSESPTFAGCKTWVDLKDSGKTT